MIAVICFVAGLLSTVDVVVFLGLKDKNYVRKLT